MMGSMVARRYALALFQLVKEQQLIDTVEEELRVVKEVFFVNEDLKAVLQSPKVSREKKKAILSTAFAAVNPLVLNTLMLLVDRHRENEIIDVANEFSELANEERGVEAANVFSVRPLTDDERTALSVSFAKKIGKKSLQIENIVDSDLLGGIKIRIGNRIFDGSLRGKLDRLERTLLG
ncbi:F0F1 ATP synthase subunit delta [Neobacillus sp. PS3-12]|jgi:F-type H+-transporting ATPase subunit delta|uniref:F0F1 ATP synthase subunit delta n=1 Tax=Neobacillus sp. PS3-12 TaxID=3070677 RepID=UPI0027DFB67C|nr:F0F1 ATP synthase subunit delta [Neobacillus sp. PS3-12]WML55260.1 F0F1 ATP synthase subunit delta [Neobacillus sp. PS3-12]